MSRTTGRFLVVALIAVLLAPLALWSAQPTDANTAGSRFQSYARPDGTTYFALSLMPQAALPAAEAGEVVVLFDTSASQMGPYREKGLETLRGMLATLGDKDRVKLVAVDLNAIPLTETFVSPRGPEMQAALQKLERRVPLGSTDLEAALNHVADSYRQASAAQRGAVYIGDGQSNANLTDVDVAGLIDRLARNRISIHSFAVGPAQDSAVLAALANQTGGVVLLDGPQIAGRDAGSQMAKSLHEQVIWPTARKLPEGLAKVYPVKTPPLRADRDTVLLGTGSADEAFAVEIQGEAGGKPVDLRWNVQGAKADDDNAYLAQLVDFAQVDGGYSLPTLGSEGLWEARRLLNGNAHALAQLGRQAAALGDVRTAQQFANEAVRRDPNSPNALVLKRALDSGRVQQVSAQLPASEELPGVPPRARDVPQEPRDGDFLGAVEQQQRVIAQKVMAESTVELNRARDRLAIDPVGVFEEMKLLMDRVMKVPELSANERNDLRNRITVMLEQATQRRIEKEVADVQREQNIAAARERERALDNLARKEVQLQGLIDRYNSLFEEGYVNFDQVTNESFRAARRDAADEFRRVASDPFGREPAASYTADEFALISGYQAENMAVRDAAARGFMDTLHLIDVSHIPFPDSPPIVYPDVSFWRKITRDRKKFASVDLSSSKPAEVKILEELSKSTTFDPALVDTPLSEAMNYIKDRHNIEVQFDAIALRDAAVDPTTTLVSINVRDISLRSALKLMLEQHNLTYIIQDEVLKITTKDKADAELVTKVYPVADLVLPIQSQQVNPFQMGGGLGGGGGGGGFGGGGGGGFGGGGLGGGGGGFGGGGLGGGGGGGLFGGGGFNVRDDAVILPVRRATGAFDVEDDLKLAPAKSGDKSTAAGKTASGKTSANRAAPAAEKTAVRAKSTVARSQNTVPTSAMPPRSDVSPEKFWNDYFAKLPQPADQKDEKQAADAAVKRNASVRAMAKELMNAKKFADVTAFISAALRHGYAQPWMYEALALAMQADNQPKAEIERALMSAVDLANSPTDLMNVAVYMARIGMDVRALKLLRQASALEPYRHEPYMHGLQIAQRLNDADGIRWASLGVLRQAWPNDKKEIVEAARYASQGLLEQLRAEGKTAAADEFSKALEAAQQRDCMVKISWTGEADIDLIVEEPTGAVCTYRNPRTAGGGIMQGDSYAKAKTPGAAAAVECSESYVLPQGFSGQYKAMLRRVWGKVATGKVTVDVYTHYGTPQQIHVRQQIPVGEADALITFDLSEGRRKEPLAQAQLATAAANQMTVSRSVLAQQISALEENSSSGGVNIPNGFGAGGANRFALPFFRRGAVGYMPVITVLPEGANLSATAVISADRRYVRISPTPFFSTIGPINTFNFATGGGMVQQ